jgi:hypothetical protein
MIQINEIRSHFMAKPYLLKLTMKNYHPTLHSVDEKLEVQEDNQFDYLLQSTA